MLEETKVKDIKISQQHISKHVGEDANRDTKSSEAMPLGGGGNHK